MPRPKRARQAPKPAAKDTHNEEPETRRQTRRTRSMGTRNSSADEAALEGANRSRDAALDRLANEDVTTTGDDTVDSVEVGRRATTPQRRDTTGLDLGDDMFGDLDDSFEHGVIPGSGRSMGSASLYGSSHIKPRSRSRQSSIIGRNDPPIRPSSRGGNTPLMSSSLNIGAFRRRAREPSILGTASKSRPDVTSTTQNHESESEEGEGDFAPEAESTPVNNRRRTRASMQQEREASPSLPELSGSRKRKSGDGVPQTSDRPEKASRSEEPQEPEAASDSESDLSSPEPQRNLRPRVERPVTPSPEDFAAPPASSGSEDEGDFWPDIHGLARRKRRPSVADPLRGDNASDVSSPPSLTHSPNYAQSKRTKSRGRSRTRRSPPPPTTADLANLMPRRRQRNGRNDLEAEVEYDTSGLGQDQDELSFARSTRRRTESRAATTRSASRGGRNGTGAALKENQSSGPNTRSASRRNGKTYSRRQSNKENESDEEEVEESMFEPLPDDTFDVGTGEPFVTTEELKRAAKFFEEVDRFEMSFEEDEEPELPLEAR